MRATEDEVGPPLWRAVRETSVRYAWFPIAVFVAHLIASRGFSAYDSFPWLDMPMHVAGGFAIAYFAANALNAFEGCELIEPSAGTLRTVLVFALASTATVVWEFAEWVTDRTFDMHAQKGLDDTLLDMLLGMVGAGAYLAAIACRRPADAAR